MTLRDVTLAAMDRLLAATPSERAIKPAVEAWRAEVDTEPIPVLPADLVADAIQAGAQ